MKYTYTKTMGGQRPSIFRHLAGWLLPILVLAVLTVTASAQNATITGRVINQGTGEYLKYAQIQVVGTDKSAITEEGGVYAITNVPAGEAKLSITYTGLDSQEATLTVPAEGTVTKDFSLSSGEYGETLKLGAFAVSGSREGNAKAIVEQRIALNLKPLSQQMPLATFLKATSVSFSNCFPVSVLTMSIRRSFDAYSWSPPEV